MNAVRGEGRGPAQADFPGEYLSSGEFSGRPFSGRCHSVLSLWPFSMPLPVPPPLGAPYLTPAGSAIARAGLYSKQRILSRKMTLWLMWIGKNERPTQRLELSDEADEVVNVRVMEERAQGQSPGWRAWDSEVPVNKPRVR